MRGLVLLLALLCASCAAPPPQPQGAQSIPVQTGIASWYGASLQGRRTANGETFDQTALTGAHRTFPLPSMVEVTNLSNNKRVIVRVNDRGPYAHGRLIDVSRAAARELGFESEGETRVSVRYIGPAPAH
jgi:rare lipoprotein A